MMLIVLCFFASEHDLPRLYDHATTSLVQFRAEKDNAFDRLVYLAQDTAYRDTVMSFLIFKFDTKSAAERHALKDMMLKIGEKAIPYIVSRIDYRGSDSEDRCLKQSLWVLAEIGGDRIVEPASAFINDPSWSVRSGAFTALGKSKSRLALPYILPGLEDTIAVVRKSAYYALSEVASIDELQLLINGLSDGHYGVRYACVKGLERIGAAAIQAIKAELNDRRADKFFLIMSLARIPEAADDLAAYLSDLDPPGRYLVYETVDDRTILEMSAEWERDRMLNKYVKAKLYGLKR